MKEIRETIVEENKICGFENPNLVNVVVHCLLYSVPFPITASSAKCAVQCLLWWGHFTAIPLFRSLDATLQSLLPRNTETIFSFFFQYYFHTLLKQHGPTLILAYRQA
jgi:hypothetical protein